MGESTTRSQSPYDPELHTMEEVEVPNSSPVHGEPALGGVGAWAPPDVGEGMDLDPVTDMAGTGDGALTGVVGLGSGQGPVEVVDSIGLSAAGGTLARPSAGCGEDVAVVGDLDMTLALAAPVAQTADSLSAASGEPPISFTYKQRRVWLRNQRRKGASPS